MYWTILLPLMVLLLGLLQSAAQLKDTNEVFGVLLLDSITFPKIIPATSHETVVLFADKVKVNNEAEFPTTVAVRENFLDVTKDRNVEENDLLFAQVFVNGAENLMLAKRHNASQLPSIQLFLKGSSIGIPFPMGKLFPNKVNIRRFISKYTGVIYQLPNTVPGFNKLALELMRARSEDAMRDVIGRATTAAVGIADEDMKALATEYLKIMHKIVDKGREFVIKELARLSDLLTSMQDTSDKDKKKISLVSRRDVLYQFDYDDILLGNTPDTSVSFSSSGLDEL
jgi:hypothetical protein